MSKKKSKKLNNNAQNKTILLGSNTMPELPAAVDKKDKYFKINSHISLNINKNKDLRIYNKYLRFNNSLRKIKNREQDLTINSKIAKKHIRSLKEREFFNDTYRSIVCLRRRLRRSFLFASGRGGSKIKYALWTPDSRISCQNKKR